MKAFLDTSVLLAAFYGDHEHHEASLDLLLRFGKGATCGSEQSLAEIYAAVTTMPGKRRLGGDAVLLFLTDVRARLTLVTLDETERFRALEAAAAENLTGGAIYHALIGHCAFKAGAETIYTWNVKDFLRLPSDIAGRVKRPDY